MNPSSFKLTDGVYFPAGVTVNDHFERLYLHTREKENRVYTDEALALLPDTPPQHPYHEEWEIRKESAARLTGYLQRMNRPLRILEQGCGNGWLANRLASLSNSIVTGTDINLTELKQAARVFAGRTNLQFIYGDIRKNSLAGRKFDIAVFAASIQYFKPFGEIIAQTLLHLEKAGEIHIIDSPFYKSTETDQAQKRTKDYYNAIGCAEMMQYYFHHSMAVLRQFHYQALYSPGGWQNRFRKNKNPFYWIKIVNR